MQSFGEGKHLSPTVAPQLPWFSASLYSFIVQEGEETDIGIPGCGSRENFQSRVHKKREFCVCGGEESFEDSLEC